MMYGFKEEFNRCRTAEELKKAYRDWAKKLHPDVNPDGEAAFKQLQKEFESRWLELKDVHMNKEGDIYTSDKATEETARAYMNRINALINIKGINVELCGSWIWVTGESKPIKDMLKAMNFKYSGNKNAWYYTTSPYRKKSKRDVSMDDIRRMYGSQSFKGDDKEQNLIAG